MIPQLKPTPWAAFVKKWLLRWMELDMCVLHVPFSAHIIVILRMEGNIWVSIFILHVLPVAEE